MKNINKTKTKQAFSILELLVVFMVIALVMGTLTPVIAKRLKHIRTFSVNKIKLSSHCEKVTPPREGQGEDESDCKLCNLYNKTCLNCDYPTTLLGDNQFLDTYDCKPYNCSDTSHGGDPHCHNGCSWNWKTRFVECNSSGCDTGYSLEVTEGGLRKKCILSVCNSKYPNCLKCSTDDSGNADKCEKCADGFSLTDGRCETTVNLKVIDGVIWTVNSAGEAHGPNINWEGKEQKDNPIKMCAAKTDEQCWNKAKEENNPRVCWKESNKKIMCTKEAADAICEYNNMGLPIIKEGSNYNVNHNMCVNSDTHLNENGFSVCSGYKCSGDKSTSPYCAPYKIWSTDQSTEQAYEVDETTYPNTKYKSAGSDDAAIVKCVMECKDYISNCTLCANLNTGDHRITCNSCADGFFVDKGECTSCKEKFGEACSKCSKNGCSECEEGYYSVNGTCQRDASIELPLLNDCTQQYGNCAFCTKERCLEYTPYYGFVNGQSVKCTEVYKDEYCAACDNSGCTKCITGYKFNNNGKCTPCAPPFDNCSECDEYGCTKCSNHCGFSNPSHTGSCISCKEEYGENCFECDESGCKACMNGYGLINGKCEKCKNVDIYCIECNELGKCTRCAGGKKLTDSGQCIQYCDTGCYECTEDKKCTKCYGNFAITKDGKCTKRTDSCIEVNDESECIKCPSYYKLSEGSCKYYTD